MHELANTPHLRRCWGQVGDETRRRLANTSIMWLARYSDYSRIRDRKHEAAYHHTEVMEEMEGQLVKRGNLAKVGHDALKLRHNITKF